MTHTDQIRKPIPRGPRGERGSINIPQIDGPFIQWQSPDGTWDDLALRVNTLGPEGPAGDAQYFSTRSQAIAHNITTGLPAIKTFGYHTPGDGGAAIYRLVTSGEDFTSLDGQKWALAEKIVNVLMKGAYGDGIHADEAAIAAALAFSDEVALPMGVYRISTNTTWPNGKKIFALQGATVYVESGMTLTINSLFNAGFGVVFTGPGTVVGLRRARPEWFLGFGETFATSTTSLTVGTGTRVFTTQAGYGFKEKMRVRAWSTATPTKWVSGLITSYSGTALTITSDAIGGTGTVTDWKIEVDNYQAFTRWIACLESDATIVSDGDALEFQFARRRYLFSQTIIFTPTLYAQSRILGAGIGSGGTRLGAMHDFSGGNAVHISGNSDGTRAIADFAMSDIAIENATGGLCARGLFIGSEDVSKTLSGLYSPSVFNGVHVVGFQYCWVICNTRLIEYNRCSADISTVANAYGVLFESTAGSTSDQRFNFFNINATPGNNSTCFGILVGTTGAGVSGIMLHHCTLYHATTMIKIASTNGASASTIYITDSQLDGIAGTAIAVTADGAGSIVEEVILTNSYIRGMTVAGVTVVATNNALIDNCAVKGNRIQNVAGGQSVFVNAASGGSVNGVAVNDNTFFDPDPGATIPVVRFSGNNRGCSFNSNRIVPQSGSTAAAKYLVQWDAASDWFTCQGNNQNGFTVSGCVNDVATTVNKSVANNI